MRTRAWMAMLLLVLMWAPAACGAAGAAVVAPAAGATTTMSTSATLPAAAGDFTLTSPAVVDGQLLPQYKCEQKVDGKEDSIPLAWTNVPAGAGSLAVIMHHYPDPNDRSKVSSYLLLWGIDPTVTEIPLGAADDGPWFMGANKDGVAISYTSPCSKGAGTHEYTITLYALSETPPSLPKQSSLAVDYQVLKQALDTVTVMDTATLTFTNTTP